MTDSKPAAAPTSAERAVFCRKYQRELPGLRAPPLPGDAGRDIYDNVSAEAWSDWQRLQTMLINERRLSMMDGEDRAYLREQMRRFLAGETHDLPSGYVPAQP